MNNEKQRTTTRTTTNKGQKCNKIGLMNQIGLLLYFKFVNKTKKKHYETNPYAILPVINNNITIHKLNLNNSYQYNFYVFKGTSKLEDNL